MSAAPGPAQVGKKHKLQDPPLVFNIKRDFIFCIQYGKNASSHVSGRPDFTARPGFVPGATNLRELTHSTWAGYIADKWKVRPNFTVNFGVRYEYWTPLDEKNSLYLAPRLQNNDARASVILLVSRLGPT